MLYCGGNLTQPGWSSSCFLSLLAFAFTLYYSFVSHPSYTIIDTPQIGDEYDFVVIGAGSAGAVIANRLSEVRDYRVLVLEAGESENDITDVPLLVGGFINTRFDWNYTMELPKHGKNRPEFGRGYCLSMTDYRCKLLRGHVVGGSSVLNWMAYVRGNKNDYNYWEYLGNKGWAYKDVLWYFLKSENNTNPHFLKTPYHASIGPLSVQDPPFTTPVAYAFLKGASYFGQEIGDINGANQEVFSILQHTQRNGRRCSTSKAFIAPVQRRSNLVISLGSFVSRIRFVKNGDNSVPMANAVHYVKRNKEYIVRARREVILCAGAINSPKILMLSGVGPKKHLEKHGIKLVKDLKVGHNLEDHVSSGGLMFTIAKPVTLKLAEAETPDHVKDYILRGRGPLTSPDGIEGTAFIYSSYANRSDPFLGPDIMLLLQSSGLYNNNGTQPFGASVFNLDPDLFNCTRYNHLLNTNLFGIYPALLQPKSRGWVLLRSRDPYDDPIIVPNYLAEEEDVKVLVDGFQKTLRFVLATFKEFGVAALDIPFPGCEQYKLFSNEYFDCVIRHFTVHFAHASCTCRMGVDPFSVVDYRFKVYGVNRLRVVDASAMPKITRGTLNAAVIMMGEKASDMIKEDHSPKPRHFS